MRAEVFHPVEPGNTSIVKEGWGETDNDVGIGEGILVRAVLRTEFDGHYGNYFDNDAGTLGTPYADALNDEKSRRAVETVEKMTGSL